MQSPALGPTNALARLQQEILALSANDAHRQRGRDLLPNSLANPSIGCWSSASGLALAGWRWLPGTRCCCPTPAFGQFPTVPPNARIVAVDGGLIANRGMTGGAATSLSEMSAYIPMAVIAIEDRRFKQHYGVDPLGLVRAMATNLMAGRLIQGGSTLTQQLAKNLFLKPQRTLDRKIQEAILAVWLETRFSKDEILELYLNRVYFGSGAYGVDAASRRYFGKSARDAQSCRGGNIGSRVESPLTPFARPQSKACQGSCRTGARRHARAGLHQRPPKRQGAEHAGKKGQKLLERV